MEKNLRQGPNWSWRHHNWLLKPRGDSGSDDAYEVMDNLISPGYVNMFSRTSTRGVSGEVGMSIKPSKIND